MSKINIKSIIVSVLNEFKADGTIKKVSMDYPKQWNVFPTVIYRTQSSPHFVDADQEELLTKWQITLEIYHNASLTDITNRISNRFNDIGISFVLKEGNTADLKRTILESTFIVDNTLKIIYEK